MVRPSPLEAGAVHSLAATVGPRASGHVLCQLGDGSVFGQGRRFVRKPAISRKARVSVSSGCGRRVVHDPSVSTHAGYLPAHAAKFAPRCGAERPEILRCRLSSSRTNNTRPEPVRYRQGPYIKPPKPSEREPAAMICVSFATVPYSVKAGFWYGRRRSGPVRTRSSGAGVERVSSMIPR